MTAAELLVAAWEEWQLGQASVAASLCREVLRDQPGHPGAQALLILTGAAAAPGRAHHDAALTRAAGVLAESTPAMTADHAVGLTLLGSVRRMQGDTVQAFACHQQALGLDPLLLPAWLGLALLWCDQGSPAAARQCLSPLAKSAAESLTFQLMLGDVECLLGAYGRAADCYQKVLAARPDHLGCRTALATCLSLRPRLALGPGMRSFISETLGHSGVDPQLLAPAAMLLLRGSPDLLADPLLLPVLRRMILCDPAVEQVMVAARRELCLHQEGSAELVAALAQQGQRNEFAWPVSSAERARLPDAPAWVRAMYGPDAIDPRAAARDRRIPALTPIASGNSRRVLEQYEANPYPRWEGVPRQSGRGLPGHLRLLTGPGWAPQRNLGSPRLLVAGCGTGRDLLGAAMSWQPASVTGLDLSSTSLRYAALMAERLGLQEVELFQADILELGSWDRRFDVIVCTGVLHHLDDPLLGWRNLARLLEPGGVMLVGLYSRPARTGIVAAQDEVRRQGFAPDPDGIRAARGHLSTLPDTHPARACLALGDFYSTSGCRDMLFHVQEQQFTLPEVAAALAELGLQFLAFEVDPATQARYSALFGASNLLCWAKLEQMHPKLFLGMYQFWCQRPLRAGTGDGEEYQP